MVRLGVMQSRLLAACVVLAEAYRASPEMWLTSSQLDIKDLTGTSGSFWALIKDMEAAGIFTLRKRAGMRLARPPEKINVRDIMAATAPEVGDGLLDQMPETKACRAAWQSAAEAGLDAWDFPLSDLLET